MQTVGRVIMLCGFAAAGVGLAVSLAIRPEAWFGAPASPLVAIGANSVAPPPRASAALTARPAALQGLRAVPRIVAPVRPAVSEPARVEPPDVGPALEWLRQFADRHRWVLAPAQSRSASAPRSESDSHSGPATAEHENENWGDDAPLPPPIDLEPSPSAARHTPRSAASHSVQTQPEETSEKASAVAAGPRETAEGAELVSRPSALGTIQSDGKDRLSINLRQADLREVFETLGQQGELNILASASVTGTVTATFNGVDAYEALQVLVRNAGLAMQRDGNFIFVGTQPEVDQLRRSHERLATRVYRPNYVSAEELQKLVSPLLTSGVGQATVSSSQLVTSSPAEKGIASSADQAGGDNFAGSDVLLIRDFESVLHYVDQVIREVDQRPLQVCLEAMILSVRLDDEDKIGVNLDLLRNVDGTALVVGSPMTELAEIDVSDGGLKFGVLNSDIGSFIDLLETVGDTNVIASPRLMCLNKQRAEILIGSQLGYVNTTVTETAATQAVEFLEVGTQLRFRPYISSDGLIRLEVHPELSTGVVRLDQGLTLPDKEVTQVTTNVMCRDGSTVIIGGLIREDLSKTMRQIPGLGNLPLLGFLFRQKTEGIDRREIIVLITPRIVREPFDTAEGEQAKFEFLERQANYADKMSPIGKRHWGLQYLRKARAAWNAGDYETALRYVNLSIHFDPASREATVLHARILEQLPPDRDRVSNHLRQGLLPGKRPHHDYSRDGYPWQSVEDGALATSVHVEVENPSSTPVRVDLEPPPEELPEGRRR